VSILGEKTAGYEGKKFILDSYRTGDAYYLMSSRTYSSCRQMVLFKSLYSHTIAIQIISSAKLQVGEEGENLFVNVQ
jgi:hypothetical protein